MVLVNEGSCEGVGGGTYIWLELMQAPDESGPCEVELEAWIYDQGQSEGANYRVTGIFALWQSSR